MQKTVYCCNYKSTNSPYFLLPILVLKSSTEIWRLLKKKAFVSNFCVRFIWGCGYLSKVTIVSIGVWVSSISMMSIQATVQVKGISLRLGFCITLSKVSVVTIGVWVSSISMMSIEATMQIQRISFRLCLSFTLSIVSIVSIETTMQIQRISLSFTLSIVSIVSIGVWISSISVMSIETTMQIQRISFRLCLSLGLRLSKSQSSQTNNAKSLHSLDVSPTSDQQRIPM